MQQYNMDTNASFFDNVNAFYMNDFNMNNISKSVSAKLQYDKAQRQKNRALLENTNTIKIQQEPMNAFTLEVIRLFVRSSPRSFNDNFISSFIWSSFVFTFLIKYARYLMNQGLRIGILEYDYGAINVDMLLLNKLRGPKCEIEMVAAACDEDCLRRRFITKLIAMAMSGYDRVIVEPSGVFDMDMFYDTLRDDPLENMYEIGNVITVVNAKLIDKLSDEEDYILASQAACAGTIILSRTQLATDEEIAQKLEISVDVRAAADGVRAFVMSADRRTEAISSA